MRVRFERERRGLLARLMTSDGEAAYALLALRGPCAEIEFPSDWHERRRAWVRLGLGFIKIAFSFPWPRVVPDEYQCSGPTYGFVFFEDGLHLYWGKCRGRRDDPMKIIGMPWRWRHRRRTVLTAPETHCYGYVLRSGDVQHCMATITSEERVWVRWWPPFRRVSRSINVEFDGQVGEGVASWKGGVLGCRYTMKRGETPLDTLRRMERERRFT